MVLASVNRKFEAISILRTAVTLEGVGLKDKRVHEAAKIQALLRLGSLLADNGQLDEALTTYKEALRILPEYYPPQVLFLNIIKTKLYTC